MGGGSAVLRFVVSLIYSLSEYFVVGTKIKSSIESWIARHMRQIAEKLSASMKEHSSRSLFIRLISINFPRLALTFFISYHPARKKNPSE